MNIRIRIKAAGKRRDMLELQDHFVPDGIDGVEKLIEFLVRENVRAFNARITDAPLFKYLSGEELEDGARRKMLQAGAYSKRGMRLPSSGWRCWRAGVFSFMPVNGLSLCFHKILSKITEKTVIL
jgi:hypothetical protein